MPRPTDVTLMVFIVITIGLLGYAHHRISNIEISLHSKCTIIRGGKGHGGGGDGGDAMICGNGSFAMGGGGGGGNVNDDGKL